MIKYSQPIFYLLSTMILIACNRKCEPFDQMPDFDALQNMSGVEEVDLDCFDSETLLRTVVIQSDSVYRSMLAPLMENIIPDCAPDTFAQIDFSSRTLIWAYTFNVDVKKIVLREGNTVTLLLKIKTSQFAIGRFRMNAVTIPKISETDTVIFQTVTYGCD